MLTEASDLVPARMLNEYAYCPLLFLVLASSEDSLA
jgi:hypothetical protein